MKTTKNYWVGICLVVIAAFLAIFTITDATCQDTSMEAYVICNAGGIASAVIAYLGLVIISSGIILEGKK
jgi:hypothetical protein